MANDSFIKVDQIINDAKKKSLISLNLIVLTMYWNIGKLIVEEESKTNKSIIEDLSKYLLKKYGRGYSRSNLFLMKKYYLSGRKIQMSGFPTWSHMIILLGIENKKEFDFYYEECIKSKWTSRELKRAIDTNTYQRYLLGNIVNKKENKDNLYFLKDPIVLEFLNAKEIDSYLEKDIEGLIIKFMPLFLNELGRGFTFVSEQERISVLGNNYYVDLVFYNIILKCYVLIDLKINSFKPENIGQMNFYLNYFKNEINKPNDNDPIGIILCKDKNDIVVSYSSSGINNIYTTSFSAVFPKKEELESKINSLLVFNYQSLGMNKDELKVLEIIKTNNNVTINEISVLTGLGRTKIKEIIKKLKENNKIKRIGNERSGFYKVNDLKDDY